MATSDERLLALEARVQALQAALEPQRVRNSLERTWNPRGTADEVRVAGADGVLLPRIYRHIQFLGGVTEDPANGRYVVAAGTGGGGASRYENYPYQLATNSAGVSDGTTYGSLIGVRQGDVCTGIELLQGTVPAGTAPTTIRAGLANSAGNVVALTGNLNTAGQWNGTANHYVRHLFAAPYEAPANDVVTALLFFSGRWSGGGQPTLWAFVGAITPTAFRGESVSGPRRDGLYGTANTDLPALGASIGAGTDNSAAQFWMGLVTA